MKKLLNSFVVVIPTYNSECLIKEAIHSTINQTFDDLGIIIRDDVSSDNTPQIIHNLIGIDGINQRYTQLCGREIIYIRNRQKLFGGGNTYDSVKKYIENKEAIVGVVDGDDNFIDSQALTKIHNAYKEKDVWQVWSQHLAASQVLNQQKGYSNPLPPDSTLYANRDYWSVSHFRTCKAWLFEQIKEKDLRDPFEKLPYCKVAADASFIYPITELCGNSKSFFLNEILYFYNDVLPANDHNKCPEDVVKYSSYIRNQQRRYQPLLEKPTL